jgi:nicotinamidase-related amidase
VSDTPAPLSGLPGWIAPGRTALVVIDVQRDFAAPDGILAGFGLDFSGVPAAIEATGRLISAARDAGVAVIFVGLGTSDETDSAVWKERMRRMGNDPDTGMDLCRLGKPGSEFYGVAPEAGDTVIWKTRYSAFAGTALDAHLRATGIDTLVLCGLTTECCVDCTARDAFHLDYHVILAEDACAAYGEDVHNSAVRNLVLNCVIAARTEDVANAWTGWTRDHG